MTRTGASTRVCLDASAVPDQPAGAGRYVVSLAAALAGRDDVDLTLVTRFGDLGRWRELAPGSAVLPLAPRARPPRLAWEQLVLPSVLRDAAVDVHHGPHYTMPERARLARVVTVHDLTFFDHPEWHERSKVVFFRRAIRVAARRADALVCVSRATADRLHALLQPAAPVHVIPHGVDHDRFRPEADEADDKHLAALGVRPPYVAFVGTIEPRKGVPTLVGAFDRVAAAADHADLTLVLAGGQGWDGGATAEAVARSRHRGRIHLTGYVDADAVPALLRHAAAVAYPSLEEGFGLPALEALACGAPLVTTAGSAMAEIAGDAAVLAPPGDSAALADALAAALAGGGAADGRRALGLAAAARHTWAASAAAHADVYRSVAQGRSATVRPA